MELKKATAVNQSDLYSFITRHELLANSRQFNDKTSYVIEDHGRIITWFQIDYINQVDMWLKKLFIVQTEALKLPTVLHTIIRFAYENDIARMYVHSKQPVTDLLLNSFSFTLQSDQHLQSFQAAEEGNWWYYSLAREQSKA